MTDDFLTRYKGECAARLAAAGYTPGEVVTVTDGRYTNTSGALVDIDEDSITLLSLTGSGCSFRYWQQPSTLRIERIPTP